METMKVVEPDGSTGNREIDYVERYDGSTRLLKPRAVPVLNDGEDLVWIMGESAPRILVTHTAEPPCEYVYTQ